MNNVLVKYEYGEIQNDELTPIQLDQLDELNKSLFKDEALSISHKMVKFNSWVGVYSLEGLTIEVLPKIDRHSTDDQNLWRSRLLHMLSKVYKLPLQHYSAAVDQQYTFLDLILLWYLNEVEKLLHKGLIKRYRRTESNIKALKGQLQVHKQLTVNHIHKERFYCSYQVLDKQTTENKIIALATEICANVAKKYQVAQKAKQLRFDLPEFDRLEDGQVLLRRLKEDRKNDYYRDALQLAEMIINAYHPDVKYGQQKAFAMVFPMEKLFEEYVFEVLQRSMPEWDVKGQQEHIFWKSDSRRQKKVIADILLKHRKNELGNIIVDTKWKRAATDQDQPSDQDLKQMFAYSKMWNADKVYLLYPWIEPKETEIGHFNEPGVNPPIECNLAYCWFDGDSTEMSFSWGEQLV